MTWPLSVSRANVDKALRLLGFDPAEVGALWIDRSQVMVQPPGELVLDGWRGCIQILNDDQYRQMTEWEQRKAAAAKAAEEIEKRRIERARQAQ